MNDIVYRERLGTLERRLADQTALAARYLKRARRAEARLALAKGRRDELRAIKREASASAAEVRRLTAVNAALKERIDELSVTSP